MVQFNRAVKALRELMNDVFPHTTKTSRVLSEVFHVSVTTQMKA